MKRELARLVSAQVFLHATMTGLRMAAPLMLLRDGASEAKVGLLLALFALTQVFLALPAGQFAEKHGLRRCFAWAVAAACLSGSLAFIWPVYGMLCLSAMLSGAACGLVIIVLQRHVGRMTDDVTQLRSAFSWLSIGPAVSNFFGPLLAGILIDVSGFRAAYALLALFPLCSWWLIRGARDHPSAQVRHPLGTQKAWDLLFDPPLRRLLLVNWFLSSCWDVHTFVVPILGHERGVSASAIGTILGVFALCATGTRLLLPIVANRFHEWQIITAAMWVTGMALFAYPLTSSAWGMGLCSGVLGLFLGAVQPMVMSTLHQITPEHRQGQALGLRLMTINASSVAMPIFFGAASAAFGVAPVFWLMAASVTIGSRWAWMLKFGRKHG
jgi:predicted MFS family arabinose efflux permease